MGLSLKDVTRLAACTSISRNGCVYNSRLESSSTYHSARLRQPLHRYCDRYFYSRSLERAASFKKSSRCLSVAASPKADSIPWVPQENRTEVIHILEIADRALSRWDITTTDFLSPAIIADAMSCLQGQNDVVVIPWGGYSQAERCRLLLGREEIMGAIRADPTQSTGVAALEVKGNFMFDPAKHPDFLGAILGTGVVRGKVGDILVQGETGAQILCDPDLVEHFEMSLTQVRTVPVKVTPIPLDKLNVRPPKVEEINSIEASLRVDAVASAGFRVSRSKMADLIKSGDVRVNWRPLSKSSADLKEGDVIACMGKGRIEIKSITTTKKEKYSITIMRYL
ncbi:hypothetical protein CEUSTIGMA_g1492.t1 [Chlamydomonas eustigma]|uniref:RNA-binding S4 domain-containing protein n=1 Tax=Chlamydomonas eustigma TaxID=1157962 RepID=A0A250WTT8_9CHLO|nr:hypothetical protein CEUSTIGMA_g1492.t1 [Chlamydomonas eustigma]|eukprot:GAX74042.1 hypothetical protein CEUSTIGMA_g1492.t1 [Chlamydomonas eustigma]